MKDVIHFKTGFKELDELINSVNEKELIIIAGRPALGKSTLAINIINNVSKQTKNKILYFNLESPKEVLRQRIIGSNVEIIDDIDSIEEIKEKCEKFKDSISLVVIDYFQFITTSNDYDSIIEMKSYLSRTLKTIALENKIPIIITYQLSRSIEQRDDKRPTLNDLIAEGSIQEDTDKLIYLYSDDYYNNKPLNELELIVAKNRGGKLGVLKLKFNHNTYMFENKI